MIRSSTVPCSAISLNCSMICWGDEPEDCSMIVSDAKAGDGSLVRSPTLRSEDETSFPKSTFAAGPAMIDTDMSSVSVPRVSLIDRFSSTEEVFQPWRPEEASPSCRHGRLGHYHQQRSAP